MPAAIPAILGTVISAAGAAYGVEQSANAQSKMNADTEQTVAQEQQLQKQAMPVYQQNLKQSTSQQPAQQGLEQALQGYKQAQNAPVSTQPIVDALPSKSVDARTQAEVARSQQASAALQQYPAQQSAWNVGNTQTNAQLGNLSQIGSSIASTLPGNLAQAQQAGVTGQSIGNLVGSLGAGVGAYGAAQKSNASYTALLSALNGTASNSPGQTESE